MGPTLFRLSSWTRVTALALSTFAASWSTPQTAFGATGARTSQKSRARRAAAMDDSLIPPGDSPPVVRGPGLDGPPPPSGRDHATIGWAHTLASPPFSDPRRRTPPAPRPHDFGSSLRVGEQFRFDLTFAGNPAGLAEATVDGIEADPRGPAPAGAPIIRLQGHARTSGIVSLLATVTDDIVTRVDAQTGAVMSSSSTIHYSGWASGPYRHRETVHTYHGRGHLHIVDRKDDEVKSRAREVPIDTFDPLSAMAWVRSLSLLDEGERARAHVVDGTTLLRFDVVSRGRTRFEDMPSIGQALGLTPDDAILLEGELTRVDRHDQPVPGRRTFSMRAWLSGDGRNIPLVMESDMWAGALKLVLTGYDPPRDRDTTTAPPRASSPAPPASGAPPATLPSTPATRPTNPAISTPATPPSTPPES